MNTPPKINHTRYFGVLGICLIALSSGCSFFGPSKEQVEAKARQETAMRMWKERCQTKAGIKIYRTAENVEGIFLMKLRLGPTNFGDQFKMDDPYGHDSAEELYMKNFLRGFYHQRANKPVEGAPPRLGYKYVEAIDPIDGKRYRYTGSVREVEYTSSQLIDGTRKKFRTKDFVLDKTPTTQPLPRYGVTYDDISTHEEREYWIAGSSLKVIDLQTNEVMAERIGYMVDYFQGSQAGGRSPWLFAADYACPTFQFNPFRPITRGGGGGAGSQPGQTLIFSEKVLHPTKE